MGSSRTAHNSRHLVQARSRALLIVQVAIKLATAVRWRSTASSAADSNDCRMHCSAAFISWSTDQRADRRDAAGQLIRYVHESAFDARMELKNLLADDGKAAIEADFVGTHTGEFAGIQPTGRAARVPTRSSTTCAMIRSARCASNFR
jgi:hypothetical protein